MTLVHESLTYVEIPSPINDAHSEILIIKTQIAGLKIYVANIYIPPASSCTPTFAASISSLLNQNYIIVGDLNAHADQWSLGQPDPRGDAINDEINNANFIALNDPDSPTRPTSGSSPDIIIVPSSLALAFDCVIDNNLNSDHLPINIIFENDVPPTRLSRSYVNFRKADWTGFTRFTESQFESLPLPSNCAQGEKAWRRVLQRASARFVPAGYVRDFYPSLDVETRQLVRERNERRQADPNDASLPEIGRQIASSIAKSSRKKWMEAVKEADQKSNPHRFWSLLKGLSGKRTKQYSNQPISFRGRVFTKHKEIANKFCLQYVNTVPFVASRESRQVYRDLKANPLDHSYTPFTADLTRATIRGSRKSTAIGPNGLAPLHLKHLGNKGIRYLTRLFNLSVREACIPAIWKSAIVAPIPKPGKPLNEGTSYRPISLMCPEVKILEKMLLPELSRVLTPNKSQHGFRRNHSTITALMPLSTKIAQGFNAPKPAARTGLLSADLAKAFDVVDRVKLLRKINETEMHPNVKRWLTSYTRDRKMRVKYQGAVSRWRKSRMGTFQGAPMSPGLFNFFIRDWEPEPEPEEVDQSFADDVHSAASNSDTEVISENLNRKAEALSDWADGNGMTVAAEKSSITLFTPWTKQVNADLQVSIKGVPVPMEKCPKLLGVKFDPLFTFSHHAAMVASKASARLKLLRALSDSEFGKDKECLISTFKAFIRPLFDYAAPIIYPNLSPSSIHRLQKIQNHALRLISGCHTAAAIDHLHDECELLPVGEHMRMLSAQFLAKALSPQHPSHDCAKAERGRRPMKETLRSKVFSLVEPYVDDGGIVQQERVREVMDRIHTDVVRETMGRLAHNRVLNQRPPKVNPNEKTLPRKTRVILAQLRSGHCARLRDYQYKIGKVPDDRCPDCDLDTQNVEHLFSCPARRTGLSVEDLWTNPREVAFFLSSHPAFDCVPPPATPPPRRRRRRGRPPSSSRSSFSFSPLSIPDSLVLSPFSLSSLSP